MNVLLLVLSLASFALANVEKVIFTAPQNTRAPDSLSTFPALNLNVLSPNKTTLRTHLPVAFPSDEAGKGLQSWYLLDGLEQGRRYEVRVCWVANQPTEFWLYAHSIQQVLDTPSLSSALVQHSKTRQRNNAISEVVVDKFPAGGRSLLLLQVFAAADFFTTNKTLMNSPLPVHVDLILDPFLLNVFPRSLLLTGAYIILLAIGSWSISYLIWKWLRDLSRDDASKQHAE